MRKRGAINFSSNLFSNLRSLFKSIYNTVNSRVPSVTLFKSFQVFSSPLIEIEKTKKIHKIMLKVLTAVSLVAASTAEVIDTSSIQKIIHLDDGKVEATPCCANPCTAPLVKYYSVE